MKRVLLTIAILLGMSLGAFAQNGNREGDVTYAPIALPEHELSDNQDASVVSSKTQTIALEAGTTFVSFYVDITLDELKEAIVAALPAGNSSAATIKGVLLSTKYQRGRWAGGLDALDMSQMYKITVSSACEIVLEDMPVDPSTLTATISKGNNWIAYPYDESSTVADFFAGFPVNNDQVKSQAEGSTKYNRGRWAGQLTTLEPGQGYIYVSVSDDERTFTFPTNAK